MDMATVTIVQARIASSRVSEMEAQGWSIVSGGVAEEGSVLMEGPEIEGRGLRHIGEIVGEVVERVSSSLSERADA